MDLSVVIASIDARRSIEECLRRLEASCAGLRTEVLVVDASSDDTAARVRACGVAATLICARPGTLAPELWAEGYRRSRGRIVAFTTGHCLATPAWARSLVHAIDGGAAGAGGPLVPGPATSPLDWAVFYLRYSAFLPGTLGRGRITGEIAGDNAAYLRAALVPHEAAFAGGFWEVDVHRLLRAQGGWLAAVPEAVMAFGRSFPFRTIFAHRFAHGRQFGAGRVQEGRPAWAQLLAAPLVPFVLATRAARRVGSAGDRVRLAVASPWFLALAGAWAAGEAWGALRGAGAIAAAPHAAVTRAPGC